MCPPRGQSSFITGIRGSLSSVLSGSGGGGGPKQLHSRKKVTLELAAATGDKTKEVPGRSENHSAKSVKKPGVELALRDTEGAEIALVSARSTGVLPTVTPVEVRSPAR